MKANKTETVRAKVVRVSGVSRARCACRHLSLFVGAVFVMLAGIAYAASGIPPGAPPQDAEAVAKAKALIEKFGDTVVPPSASEADGPSFPVSGFIIEYAKEHPFHPPLDDVLQREIVLGQTVDGYIAPRAGIPAVTFKIGEFNEAATEKKFFASAIRLINQRIVDYFKEDLKYIGIYVMPSPEDIVRGEDVRPADRRTLKILVMMGEVTQLRTIASGKRIPAGKRIDNPVHKVIKERSPIQPGDPAAQLADGRSNLLRRDRLDSFVHRLNRHPGRRVDVAVASAGAGDVALDFLVSENKPWMVYSQVTNTGTEQTDKCRYRFGFIHNQVTGNDDVFKFDYITAGLSDDARAYIGSYEAPVPGTERWRWKVFGSCTEFTASDIGFANEKFTGDGWSAGGEIIANVYQYEDFFVDLVGGAKWRNISVDNQVIGLKGEDDLFLPYTGFRFECYRDTSSTSGSLMLEWSQSNVSSSNSEQLGRFGRLTPDGDWVVFKWDMQHSQYLEPLFNGEAWKDVSTPESSTLAHEVELSFRGQYTGNRLIPQMEEVVGGFRTVRGYEESVVAGDSVVIGSVEYRYHIPRSFRVQPDPSKTRLFGRPFRFAPQHAYGRPDWDLIFRAFFDVGHTYNSTKRSYESDESLAGTGVGLELQLLNNLTLRADWGVALEDVAGGEVDSGDSRVHVEATIVF